MRHGSEILHTVKANRKAISKANTIRSTEQFNRWHKWNLPWQDLWKSKLRAKKLSGQKKHSPISGGSAVPNFDQRTSKLKVTNNFKLMDRGSEWSNILELKLDEENRRQEGKVLAICLNWSKRKIVISFRLLSLGFEAKQLEPGSLVWFTPTGKNHGIGYRLDN